jgi:hypothetical protein
MDRRKIARAPPDILPVEASRCEQLKGSYFSRPDTIALEEHLHPPLRADSHPGLVRGHASGAHGGGGSSIYPVPVEVSGRSRVAISAARGKSIDS